MQKYKKGFVGLVICVFVASVLAGCFQAADGDQLQATDVAQAVTSPAEITPDIIPTVFEETAEATLEITQELTAEPILEFTEEATVEVTLEPIIEFTEEPTLEDLPLLPTETATLTETLADLPLLPSETSTPQPVAIVPSATPQPLPTTALPATEDLGQGGAIDPIFLTATAIIAQSSAQPLVPSATATATAGVTTGPTQFAPSASPVVGMDPIFLTATAIIANLTGVPQVAQLPTATATASATLAGLEVTEDAGQGGGDESVFLTATALNINPNSLSSIFEVAQAQEGDVTDPLALTATSIVARATETAAAQLTATAQAILGATPIPTIDTGAGGNIIQPTQPILLATNTPPPVVSGADCVHEVRAEDQNLYRLSLRYGVTVHDIARASGITNINLITVGQRLTIPGCGTTGQVPPPTSVPGSDAGGGAVANPGTGGSGGGRVHTVQQNETLFELSLQYGVLVNDIAAANGLSNINLIYIGQELVIP